MIILQRVEVKFDNIGKSLQEKSGKAGTEKENQSLIIAPSRYKCEIKAYDTDTI